MDSVVNLELFNASGEWINVSIQGTAIDAETSHRVLCDLADQINAERENVGFDELDYRVEEQEPEEVEDDDEEEMNDDDEQLSDDEEEEQLNEDEEEAEGDEEEEIEEEEEEYAEDDEEMEDKEDEHAGVTFHRSR